MIITKEETNYQVVICDKEGNTLYNGPAKRVTIEGSVSSAIKGGKGDFIYWFPYKEEEIEMP